MDISGLIREALHKHVAPAPPESIDEPLAFYVQMVAIGNHPPVGVPLYLRPGAKSILVREDLPLPVHRYLALASAVRVLPRISRIHREPVIAALRPQFDTVVQSGEKLLFSRATPAAEFLWHYWLLILARDRLLMTPPDMLMKGLWRRGWGGQSKEGFLHPREPGPPANAVSNDLAALHAAYNAVAMTQELERLEAIEKLVHWHVAHTPAEQALPWGLAAFAALDEGDYAARLATAATASLASAQGNEALVTLTLMADGLVTQEEVAAG